MIGSVLYRPWFYATIQKQNMVCFRWCIAPAFRAATVVSFGGTAFGWFKQKWRSAARLEIACPVDG